MRSRTPADVEALKASSSARGKILQELMHKRGLPTAYDLSRAMKLAHLPLAPSTIQRILISTNKKIDSETVSKLARFFAVPPSLIRGEIGVSLTSTIGDGTSPGRVLIPVLTWEQAQDWKRVIAEKSFSETIEVAKKKNGSPDMRFSVHVPTYVLLKPEVARLTAAFAEAVIDPDIACDANGMCAVEHHGHLIPGLFRLDPDGKMVRALDPSVHQDLELADGATRIIGSVESIELRSKQK